ncbi:MAG: PIN domain-containing protein [Myxococcales bacterium]|nr:MAG: PIN domain-containing protein [Myxococcales bacterium]
MNVPDVNVMIALFRPDHVHHSVAATWWDQAAAAGEPFTVPDVVWSGFLRIVTSRRVFTVPASFAEAWAFVESVIAQPTYARFISHPRTLAEFARLAGGADARGNLVADAFIAACAGAYGGTVVTFDRDFRRFDGLRVLEIS